jgi:hypothetical protein
MSEGEMTKAARFPFSRPAFIDALGSGRKGSGQLATAAQFVGPKNIVVDGQRNVYFSASGRSMDLKVATNGCTSRTPATT